jgi:ubiquinone/menaquinone biosynthesis C-methylase UbiE
LQRCGNKIRTHGIHNAEVCQASLTAIPLPNESVNKILCLSVLQYLSDDEVVQALDEFLRVLAPGGTIILHVKNSSSLYWSTLRVAKRVKRMLGMGSQSYYVRSFHWYINQLKSRNCSVEEYKSFNLLTIDGMPQQLVTFMQGVELRHQTALCKIPFARNCGADLKIRATRAGF